MEAISTCSLCDRKRQLQNSHIVPRFVMKFARKQGLSPSTFSDQTGKSVQDLPKIRLLCRDCEQKFSQRGETLFSQQLFRPLNEAVQRNDKTFSAKILGSRWHHYFVVSLCWRVTMSMIHQNTMPKLPLKEERQLKNALQKWKDYLNGKCTNVGAYNVFLFPLYDPNKWKLTIPTQALNQYVEIGIDWCLLRRDKPDSIIVVIKLQRMLIVGQLTGKPWSDCHQLSIDDIHYNAIEHLYLPRLLTTYIALSANDISKRLLAQRQKDPERYDQRLARLLEKHSIETIWDSEIYRAYEKDLERVTSEND